MENIAAFIEWTPQDSAQAKRQPPRLSELVLCTIGLLQLTPLQEGHQEGQRRFSSLIFIGPIGVQAVPTTARGRVVECNLEIVVSQEPIKSAPCLFAPMALPRAAVGLQACRDDRARLHRLMD